MRFHEILSGDIKRIPWNNQTIVHYYLSYYREIKDVNLDSRSFLRNEKFSEIAFNSYRVYDIKIDPKALLTCSFLTFKR
jgi:hypothetical protein